MDSATALALWLEEASITSWADSRARGLAGSRVRGLAGSRARGLAVGTDFNVEPEIADIRRGLFAIATHW